MGDDVEWLRLEAHRFTSEHALVREVLALLDATTYHIAVEATEWVAERLAAELEGRSLMGRLKIVNV